MHELDKSAGAEAIYSQVVRYFREGIREGKFGEGDVLPPELEIARELKISRGTVRHALNILVNEGLLQRIPGRGTFVQNPPPVPDTRTRLSPKRLGLVLSQPTLQVSMDILVGVEQASKSRGYEVSLTFAGNNSAQQARDIARLKANEVSGIILFPVDNAVAAEGLVQLKEARIPLVLVDRYIPGLDTDYVVSNNTGGGYRATEHLIILGYSRIGFAYSSAASLETTSVRDRWLGYRKALETYGLGYEERLVFPDMPLPPAPAPNAYDAFVLDPERPRAVFAVNDSVALQILQAAQRQGVRVPEDLALVGFDDLSFAAYLTPPLTTVAQPRVEIGIRATNLLINRIEGEEGPYQHVELPTNLLVRASCGVRLQLKHAGHPSTI